MFLYFLLLCSMSPVLHKSPFLVVICFISQTLVYHAACNYLVNVLYILCSNMLNEALVVEFHETMLSLSYPYDFCKYDFCAYIYIYISWSYFIVTLIVYIFCDTILRDCFSTFFLGIWTENPLWTVTNSIWICAVIFVPPCSSDWGFFFRIKVIQVVVVCTVRTETDLAKAAWLLMIQ